MSIAVATHTLIPSAGKPQPGTLIEEAHEAFRRLAHREDLSVDWETLAGAGYDARSGDHLGKFLAPKRVMGLHEALRIEVPTHCPRWLAFTLGFVLADVDAGETTPEQLGHVGDELRGSVAAPVSRFGHGAVVTALGAVALVVVAVLAAF